LYIQRRAHSSPFFKEMRTKQEILKKIAELTPEFELAEEAYFSSIEEKQNGEDIYMADFLKLESECQ